MNAKKKKIYGAIVLMGLAALLVDRLVFTEPAPAVAAEDRQTQQPASPQDLETTDSAPSVAAAPFPRGLPEFDPPETVRDLFLLTPAARRFMLGVGAGAPTGEAGGENAAYLGRPTIARFSAAHQLSAVMTGAGTRMAIVDGQRVKVGQPVDGCKLLEIIGQAALFECADGVAKLKVSALNH